MADCPMYGGWHYEQHSGHKPSQHTEMSSVRELHIYNLGANTDSKNKQDKQNWASGWSLHGALRVPFFLVSSSPPRVRWSVG